MVAVSSPVVPPAEPEAAARESARREIVNALRVASAITGYSAAQIANGLGPGQARQAAAEAAAELEAVAALLRRLSRPVGLDTAERRRQVELLAGRGLSQSQIAVRIGMSRQAVSAYLAGRRAGSAHGLAATNVPHPGRVSMSPSAASGPSALRTVRGATSNSWASVEVDGIRDPGGYWPEAIRARTIASTCSLGVSGRPRSIGLGGFGVSWSAMLCIVPAALPPDHVSLVHT
jgi:DNA-binding CsgD family transcriptional regulator